jgi:Zn-dependent M28 family amino/carboxypeptidase
MAVLLEAAGRLQHAPHVGVLITDGEELALAGARAWVDGRPRAIALNCDGVDDVGVLTLMTVGQEGAALVEAFRAECAGGSVPLRVIRLIPGVMTDSVAFASAGWPTVTLSRGSLRTLGRIHTTRDTLRHLTGKGIVPAAELLARVAGRLG